MSGSCAKFHDINRFSQENKTIDFEPVCEKTNNL